MRAHTFELARGMTPERIEAFDSALASADVSGLSPEATSVLRLSLQGARTLSVQSVLSDKEALEKPVVLRSAQEYFAEGEYRRCTKTLVPAMSSASNQKLSLLATCSFLTGDYETTLFAAKNGSVSNTAFRKGLTAPSSISNTGICCFTLKVK